MRVTEGLLRWTLWGAALGLFVAATDLLAWRGQRFLPWDDTNHIAENIGYFIGTAIAVGLLALAVKLLVNAALFGSVKNWKR